MEETKNINNEEPGSFSEIQIGNDEFVPIELSSDSDDIRKNQISKENLNLNNINIVEKFKKFTKKKVNFMIDESLLELAPPQSKPILQTLIKNVKKWMKRNPTDEALFALEILIKRIQEFLELQTRRDDPEYEELCRDLLSLIYKNTVEAQRLSRKLKEEAQPRSIDEFSQYL